MKKEYYITIGIVLFLSAGLAAGLFYFLNRPANQIAPSSPAPSQTAFPEKLPEPENEFLNSSPYEIKGEISRGNPDKKQIIFTFDCGSGNNSVQKILDAAKKHGAKLTFFTTGKFAQKYPDSIKQISAQGHEIFNHTYSHPYLTEATDEQIAEEFNKTDEILKSLTGQSAKPYFRPPYGNRNQHVLEYAQSLGYQSVFWTIDGLDWMTDRTEEQVKQQIYSHLKNGAIVLMHVGDDITGNILDEVFTYVEDQGYQIVNLTEGIK